MPTNKIDIAAVARAEREQQQARRCRLYCCASTGCVSCGCRPVMQALTQAIETHGITEQVEIVPTGCMGPCSMGPLLRVEAHNQEPVLYCRINALLARLVVYEHVLPIVRAEDDYKFQLPEFLREFVLPLDMPFFTHQTRVVLENTGTVNPERIEDYLAHGGYEAIEKVLTTMTPEQVIEEITASGLRGRGGGGFSTGAKWRFARASEGEEKFFICNGDEGDPGAYMDRSVLEGDPHAVLEGMLIGAYATGATQGWVYIRAEYPEAVESIEKAIRQARKYRLLGSNLFGTDFCFNCEVRLGAGAFVCGEETALIHSIEGQRGTPRPRPPYPTVRGLWNQPTTINNVETLANIPRIIMRGSQWFAGIGTATSKGTKVFALTGKVRHSGLIEVPMGISLREVVEVIGGGTITGKPIKAVQTGGPSGGMIPNREMDVPVCYEELRKLGSIMGSGGMIVLDEADCTLSIASFYLKFTVDESCGKCAPCRIGGTQMLALLEKIRDGKGTEADLTRVKNLARAMQKASLCGLGQTAPNPVSSSLKYFEEDYRAHLASDTGASA